MSELPYQTLRIAVDHDSAVGHARRATLELAARGHVPQAVADRASLVVTELATNLVRHARGGDLFLQLAPGGIEVVASDAGPGITNVGSAMRDGFSTAGTPGNGLGAIKRAATSFDISSKVGKGTIAAARIYAEPSHAAFQVGALCVAIPGEVVVGDAWGINAYPTGVSVIVADGLGHGPEAARASATAVRLATKAMGHETLQQVADTVHTALKATRGAAVALASIDVADRTLTFLGVGNIASSIFGTRRHSLASQNGTMGGMRPRIHRFSYAFEPGAVLVMCSDGIGTRWSLEDLPGILTRDPLVIAAAIMREGLRGSDDATVFVLRETPA